MRKQSLTVSITIIVTLVLALAVIAVAADPFLGTWKINLEKSKFSPGPAPKSGTLKIDAQKNGLKYVGEGVNAEGNPTHAEFAFRFDGKDYPVKSTLMPPDATITVKRIDANTHDSILKQAGKEISTGREVISKNGKTMTRTTKGKSPQGQDVNNTVVYDKQ